MAGGAVAFAAFSAAIDLFLRRETSEYVTHHVYLHLSFMRVEPNADVFFGLIQ